MDTLLIVDGHAIIHRAYHALPAFKTKGGVPTNALYGFVTMLDTAIKDFNATHVVVCLDSPEKTFRDDMFPEYRSHRPKVDEDLIKQFPMVRDFLRAAHITQIEKGGFEADDLIATIVHNEKDKDLIKLILTGDKDILQLVDSQKHILVATPQNGNKKPLIYDDEAVTKRFNVGPKNIADFKALAGDSSDNYKGVAGIGPKTAAQLINQFGTLEEIYEHVDDIQNPTIREKLVADKENATLSKKLALLDLNVPIDIQLENLAFTSYNEELKNFFEEYQFNSLKRRFFNESAKPIQRLVKNKKAQPKNQLGLF